MIGLSAACRWISVSMIVGLVGGEEAGALHRRQLERIAQHQHLGAEAQQVLAQLLIDHRDFVDDDEIGIGGRRFIVEHEARLALLLADQRIDQRWMVWAPLQPRLRMTSAALPVKAAYLTDLTSCARCTRQRRLAGAGPAEQAEHLRARACP